MPKNTSLSGSYELLRVDNATNSPSKGNSNNTEIDHLTSNDLAHMLLMEQAARINKSNETLHNAEPFIGKVLSQITEDTDVAELIDIGRSNGSNIVLNANEIPADEEDEDERGDKIGGNLMSSTKKNSRKQIQFNLDPPNPRSRSSRRNTGSGANFNLSELLNQLKMNELKKRKANQSRHLLEKQKKTTKENKNPLVHLFVQLTKYCVYVGKKLQQAQVKIGNFIERPYEHRGGLFYCIFKFSIILFSIVIGSLTTLPPNEVIFPYLLINNEFFYFYELFASLFLSIEYIIFIWSIGNRLEFNGMEGRIRFIRQSLLLTLEALLIPVNATIFIMSAVYFEPSYLAQIVSALRFFQIFRFLFIDRYAQTWKLLLKVVYKHRFELITSVYIGTIILLFSSYFILIFEKEYSEEADDNHFHTYADALYWSIITMATIGYGKVLIILGST
jgi:hypothetical protein